MRGLSVSLGQVAALIAAIAFLLLCGALAVPILRLRHTVDAATNTINDINDRTGPILGNVNTTIENVNTALTQAHTTLEGVNLQLARLDTITEHVSHVTANVANLTTVVTSAAASPLGKAAASSAAQLGALAHSSMPGTQRVTETTTRATAYRGPHLDQVFWAAGVGNVSEP